MHSEYEIAVRKAREDDAAGMHRLICELALYERAPDEVVLTVEQLRRDGFESPKRYEAFVAEQGGELVGLALYYPRYSTWKGLCYYLEDLVVQEKFRGRGLGKRLLQAVAQATDEAGAARLQWQVLDWNSPAIEFYENIGAFIDREWFDCKLDRSSIRTFLEQSAQEGDQQDTDT